MLHRNIPLLRKKSKPAKSKTLQENRDRKSRVSEIQRNWREIQGNLKWRGFFFYYYYLGKEKSVTMTAQIRKKFRRIWNLRKWGGIWKVCINQTGEMKSSLSLVRGGTLSSVVVFINKDERLAGKEAGDSQLHRTDIYLLGSFYCR